MYVCMYLCMYACMCLLFSTVFDLIGVKISQKKVKVRGAVMRAGAVI